MKKLLFLILLFSGFANAEPPPEGTGYQLYDFVGNGWALYTHASVWPQTSLDSCRANNYMCIAAESDTKTGWWKI